MVRHARRRIPPVGLLLVFAGLTAVLLVIGPASAHADAPVDVSVGLARSNVYVSPHLPPRAHQSPGDLALLRRQFDAAGNQGVTEYLAVTDVVPSKPRHAHADTLANELFNHLGLTNSVLVLVSPRGIGVASDQLSTSERVAIERKSVSVCESQSWAACAVYAGQRAASQVRADKNSAFSGAVSFWVIVLIILALIVLGVVFYFRRRARAAARNLDELRTAARNTLSTADSAVEQLEASGQQLSPDVRTQYDRALGLRDRARNEIENGTTDAALVQANEDAAQAVLALQGVMRAAGVQAPLTSALDVPEHRCFYCGRTDRPPYVTRTIDDGRGNSMEIEICSVDQARLARGQTPRIATVQYGGSPVPWWSVPDSPYYYAYGGPTWQYWLPFMVGVDVGSWFGGGGGGYVYGGPDYDDYGWQGDSGYGDQGQTPADVGAGDFGGWGDSSGSSDSSGGDFGGWGGGDSGGDGGGDGGGGNGGGGNGGGD